MTKTEVKAFRAALENRQSELGNGSWNREALAIQTSSEDLDRIQQASDRDWAMGNLARNSSRLREVRAALGRIDTDTFGICAECEAEINPKRLAAVPWARLCIVCQEAADLAGQTARNEIETSLILAA